ncbi:hypothetical protein [Bacillus sp. WL1]
MWCRKCNNISDKSVCTISY